MGLDEHAALELAHGTRDLDLVHEIRLGMLDPTQQVAPDLVCKGRPNRWSWIWYVGLDLACRVPM